MGTWFWLNIPLATAFFLAMTGIPLRMVFKHPDEGRDRAAARLARATVSQVRPGATSEGVPARQRALPGASEPAPVHVRVPVGARAGGR